MSFRNFKRDNLRIQKTQNLEKIRVSREITKPTNDKKLKKNKFITLTWDSVLLVAGFACLLVLMGKANKLM